MTHRYASHLARGVLMSLGAALVFACGGNRPVEQPPEPMAQAPAATPTVPDAATAPAAESTATAIPPAPPPTETAPPKPAPKAARPSAAVAEAPKPAPKPEPIIKTLVAGTAFETELIDGASSKTSKVGDPVRARVTQAVVVDGTTVVPEGAVISGTVTEAQALMKIGGQAILGLKFDTLQLPGGGTTPIVATIQTKGKSESGKDAGTIAGATAGGALLGRLLSKNDKTKGTLIGAVVGAAAGTGAAAATKGQEVILPAGTPMPLHLDEAAQVTVQP